MVKLTIIDFKFCPGAQKNLKNCSGTKLVGKGKCRFIFSKTTTEWIV
jgi:hypothetical protein